MKCKKSLAGIQSNNKKELAILIKYCKRKEKYKIEQIPKPSWWYGKWNRLYEIKKKKVK